MGELLKELTEWSSVALPAPQQVGKGKQKAGFDREQFLLRTNYWSAKILITRPCLCRIERRITNESDASASFNKRTAEACVEAALEMTKLFPDQPDLDFLYTKGPWWAVVHLSKLSSMRNYATCTDVIVPVMQAMAVLLLEMAYRDNDVKNSDPSMTESIKKLIRWLRAMQHDDPVAARAYHVIWKILKGCAPALQSQANDLLALDEKPNPQPQGPRGPQSTFNAQETKQALRRGYYYDPMDATGAFDPQPFQQQPLDDLAGYQDGLHTFFPPDEHLTPMAFGNPFYTSFDQGAPVVNMQDLWGTTEPSSAFDSGVANLNISQNRNEGQMDPDILFAPPPVPYHYSGP